MALGSATKGFPFQITFAPGMYSRVTSYLKSQLFGPACH